MNSSIYHLESKGEWEKALYYAKEEVIKEGFSNSITLHILGRLYQRLGNLLSARKAYLMVLERTPNSPKTLNNLILLDLNLFKISQANEWLEIALRIPNLSSEEKELIFTSACDLKLFELEHLMALKFVDKQIGIRKSVIALCNKSICLQKLNRIDEAISFQLEAVRLHLNEQGLKCDNNEYLNLIGKRCGDLESSMRLQTILMNLGILKLSKNSFDQLGIKLILSGMSNDRDYWINASKSKNIWKGNYVDKLIIWDDQGYGDSIQNLAWVESASLRAREIELWLRPSLLKLVKDRFILPKNCSIKSLHDNSLPFSGSIYHVGMFFLPFVLNEWKNIHLKSYRGCITKKQPNLLNQNKFRIGLVWSAGKHTSPQPERSARIRDIPFHLLWNIASSWKKEFPIEILSLQLTGNEEEVVEEKIKAGELLKPLTSNDWLSTAKVIESLDLLISVDTSVAHLAGAMGINCLLMLSCPSDWRWTGITNKTLIYNSFLVCRCEQPGNWNEALTQANILGIKILSSKAT